MNFSKAAKPILDSQISSFLRSLKPTFLFGADQTSPVPESRSQFLNDFQVWSSPRLSSFLTTWEHNVTDGTTAAFQDFAHRHKNSPLYVLRGEYPFHHLTGASIVDSVQEIPSEGRLIISHPFSATGDTHPELSTILNECSQRNIPVLLDCALLFVSRLALPDIHSYSCIEAVAFSLSKSFCTGRFRIGVCYTKEPWTKTPSHVLNDWSYLNHLSMVIHSRLLAEYPVDYIYTKYSPLQRKICERFNLAASKTVIFGTTHHPQYDEFSRSGVINRLCLSDLLQSEAQ